MSTDSPKILPRPTHVDLSSERVSLHPPLTVSGLGTDPVYEAVQIELGAQPAQSSAPSIALLSAVGAPQPHADCLENDEGYVLSISPEGIRIHAASPAGHLYGVMTLRQLVITYGDNLPCLTLADTPAFAHRGQQYCLVQGHTAYQPEYMEHLVPQLARWKINTLYLYLETAFQFPSLPGVGGPDAMTPDDAAQLHSLCERYNITLVPMLNVLGHNGELLGMQTYHRLLEHAPEEDARTMHGASLCPSSPDVRDLVKRQLQDMMAAFPGELIHVGGDEVGAFGQCRACAKRVSEVGELGLYLEYIDWVRGVAEARGRRIGIWGDMLLHYADEFENAALADTFAKLRDAVIIYDWHYTDGSRESLELFAKEGFETVACSSSHLCYTTAPWLGQTENQRRLFHDASETGAKGAMTTSWMNFQGLHDELYNVFFASSAAMLWSGAATTQGEITEGMTLKQFETDYCRLRYGYAKPHLAAYWHLLGDAKGPVVSLLQPLGGANPRKCLFHTDNVLTFWRQYAPMLSGDGISRYRTALQQAEEELALAGDPELPDPYVALQAGPLLIHRHLMNRFEHCERAYALYAEAADVQVSDKKRFASLLEESAQALETHLDDFPDIIAYLQDMRECFGLEQTSIQRLRATIDGIQRLAALIRGFAADFRPLPSFVQLEDAFLRRTETHYWINREHEWSLGPEPFQRYSIQAEPWRNGAIRDDRE